MEAKSRSSSRRSVVVVGDAPLQRLPGQDALERGSPRILPHVLPRVDLERASFARAGIGKRSRRHSVYLAHVAILTISTECR